MSKSQRIDAPYVDDFLSTLIKATASGEIQWKPLYHDLITNTMLGKDTVSFNTMYKGKNIVLIEYSNIDGVPHYVVELYVILDSESIFSPEYPKYQEKIIELFLYVEKQNPTLIEDYIDSFIKDFN